MTPTNNSTTTITPMIILLLENYHYTLTIGYIPWIGSLGVINNYYSPSACSIIETAPSIGYAGVKSASGVMHYGENLLLIELLFNIFCFILVYLELLN